MNAAGVPPDVEELDLRKAYLRLALDHHPDKGGDRYAARGTHKLFLHWLAVRATDCIAVRAN